MMAKEKKFEDKIKELEEIIYYSGDFAADGLNQQTRV